MSLSGWFGWSSTDTPFHELPEIFPIGMRQIDFVRIDVINIYSKILIDALERVHGISDEQVSLLWDNCVQSESEHGLITSLAMAMADRKDLFMVYEKALGVVRHATPEEASIIRNDYKTQGESSTGVYISFRNYLKSDMIKLYSALEYCTVSSLHKTMNLSKAVQLKMNDLRGAVSLTDSADVKAQAQAIAKSLSEGKDVLLDGKDMIANAVPDLTAINASIDFLNEKRCFYLGMPKCYISGEQTAGMGTTGENDTKATERGLKNYYFSVLKPVLEAIFDIDTSYKSQDFRQIAGSMDVLKTFSLTDETLISHENKLKIVNQLLDLGEDAKGDPAPAPVVQPVIPPVGTTPPPPFKAPGNGATA